MITTDIRFGGVEYTCRMVKDNQGDYLIIGSTALLDALQPGSFEDDNEGFVSEEGKPDLRRDFLLHRRAHPFLARQGAGKGTKEG